MIKALPMLLFLVSSALAADEMRPGAGLLSQVPVVSDGVARSGEVSLREFVFEARGKTSHAVQMIVRDPATGLFWMLLQRSDTPLTAAAVRSHELVRHRFAVRGGRLIVFRLETGRVALLESRRTARSLDAALSETEPEVERELATTWPITTTFPPAGEVQSVLLSTALPTPFLVDSPLHPSPYRLSLRSLAFVKGRWDLTLENEKRAVAHLFFSESLRPLHTK